MSRPMAETPKRRRPRRRFDDDFKAQAVRLVLDEGKTVGAVARDLDLTETALRGWVKRAQADRTHGRTGLTTAEREELARRHSTIGYMSPATFERHHAGALGGIPSRPPMSHVTAAERLQGLQ